ncbi:MAG: PIG-L family deacetylase [Thermodesulfobacteriota bacterium]|nr:PIG-L family deacetylase [Thermodesulfobacteriota bacterium]
MHLPNIESIEKFYKSVYVSPHMDDGVISCGGRMLKQLNNGESVLVVTVFTGNIDEEKRPRGQALAHLINTNDRRMEDKRAMERLGVDYLRLDYLDRLFRRRPALLHGVTPSSSGAEKRLSDNLGTDIRRICIAAGNSK